MSDQPALPGFDYGALSHDARETVQMERDFIRDRMKRTASDIIAIGRSLTAAKEALPHGQFGPWLDAEFGWSQPTASRFMAVYRAFGNRQSIPGEYFESHALYTLASGDVPDEVREEFIERAEAGERITHAMVRESIRPTPVVEDDPVVVDQETGEILSMPQPAPVVVPEPLAHRLEEWKERHAPRVLTPEEHMADKFPVYVNEITKLDPAVVAAAMLAADRNTLELCMRAIPRLTHWLEEVSDPIAMADTSARFRVVR